MGLVNDDAVAIAGTFWRDYHWGRYLLALVGGSALWIFISGRLQKALILRGARERECSFGAGVVLHARGGFSYVNSKTFYGERLSKNETLRLKAIQDARRALAWYYFEKGEKLNIVPAKQLAIIRSCGNGSVSA